MVTVSMVMVSIAIVSSHSKHVMVSMVIGVSPVVPDEADGEDDGEHDRGDADAELVVAPHVVVAAVGQLALARVEVELCEYEAVSTE
tara:strand:+ start:248 stop:508 length:261 start_codon:yes stop_codon:yes gene_type:complete